MTHGFHPDSLFRLVIKGPVDAADVQVDFHWYLGRVWYIIVDGCFAVY